MEVQLVYSVVLVSGVQQSDSVIYTCMKNKRIHLFFFRCFSLIDYYKILRIIPCAIQLVLVYFIYRSGYLLTPGFPGGTDGKRICLQCRKPGFDSPWRREWQPTSVSLPREFHGPRSLVGYSPWSCKELDRTEQLRHTHLLIPNS